MGSSFSQWFMNCEDSLIVENRSYRRKTRKSGEDKQLPTNLPEPGRYTEDLYLIFMYIENDVAYLNSSVQYFEHFSIQ